MNELPLSKRELLKELGITDRLLKFWVGWYKLPVNRRGRGSNYPPQTVHTLRLIKRLADSKYFTMRFVRDLLQAAQSGDRRSVDSHLDLCRSVMNGTAAPARPMASSETRIPAAAAAAPSGDAVKMGEDLL